MGVGRRAEAAAPGKWFIPSFIHSFLNPCCLPGNILDRENDVHFLNDL